MEMKAGLAAMKNLDVTHVRYYHGDILGKVLAIVTLFPVLFQCHLFIELWARREIPSLTLIAGTTLNHMVSTAIKKAFMAFLAGYALLRDRALLAKRAGGRQYGVLASLCAVLVGWSRVYLGYHDVAQVVVGSALGLVLGSAWWALSSSLIPHHDSWAASFIGRLLELVRPTSNYDEPKDQVRQGSGHGRKLK